MAILVWHLAGNLKSRFTDFLSSDGEKPWRRRDSEFASRKVTRSELLEKWNDGWDCLFASLEDLSDENLGDWVSIRGQQLTVHEHSTDRWPMLAIDRAEILYQVM